MPQASARVRLWATATGGDNWVANERRTQLFPPPARGVFWRSPLARSRDRAQLRHCRGSCRRRHHHRKRLGLWCIPLALRPRAVGRAGDDPADHRLHRLVHAALFRRRQRLGHSTGQGSAGPCAAGRSPPPVCVAAAQRRQARLDGDRLHRRPVDRARRAVGASRRRRDATCAALAVASQRHRHALPADRGWRGRDRSRLQRAVGWRGVCHRRTVGPARIALQRAHHDGHRAGRSGRGVRLRQPELLRHHQGAAAGMGFTRAGCAHRAAWRGRRRPLFSPVDRVADRRSRTAEPFAGALSGALCRGRRPDRRSDRARDRRRHFRLGLRGGKANARRPRRSVAALHAAQVHRDLAHRLVRRTRWHLRAGVVDWRGHRRDSRADRPARHGPSADRHGHGGVSCGGHAGAADVFHHRDGDGRRPCDGVEPDDGGHAGQSGVEDDQPATL